MSAYIIPTAALDTMPTGTQWHATAIESDPSQSLVVVLWDDPNAEHAFEARPDVLVLGDPWDPMPPEATTLLGSEMALMAPLEGGPVVVPTVSATLRKMEWPGGRLIR